MNDIDSCTTQVRMYDNDRFLSTLFAPADRREDLIALYAFNLELSKLRETISEPLIGRMRLQFWRDALESIEHGAPPAHEVARPLAEAVRRRSLPITDLQAVIDAREVDLDETPPTDVPTLMSYTEGTASAIISLSLRILGVPIEPLAETVRNAGIAIGFVGLSASIPHQVAAGRTTLPMDLCASCGLDASQPQQWPDSPDVRAIVGPMLDTADKCVAAVRSSSAPIPRRAMPAFLPLTLAALSAKALRRNDNDPFALAMRPLGIARPLTVFWHQMIGRP